MSASLLCRQIATELVGTSYDQTSHSVLVTVQGDGVTAYDLEQKKRGSLPLGSQMALQFQAASVQRREQPHDQRNVVASIVHNNTTKSYTLCVQDWNGAKGTISDAPTRVPLPGPTHSCHLLRRQQPASAMTAAVVLADGRIGVSELGSSEPTGRLAVLASEQQSAPRHILAASAGDTLAVATQQSAGSAVSLRVLRLSPAAASGLTPVKALSLACPGGGSHAVPTGLTLTASYALLQWSNGYATAVHGLPGGSATPLRCCNFPLADAVGANGASSSAPAAASAPTASGRKRKSMAAAAAAGAQPRVLCGAVDDHQFIVLDLGSAAAQSQICYSIHDAQFGCPLSSGMVLVDTPLLSLDLSQCAVVGCGPDAVVVQLGGAVHALHVQPQPVSLLSLVARLSVSAAAPAAAAAAGAAGQQQPRVKPSAAGVRGVAPVLLTPPAPVALDPGLLSGPGSTPEGGDDGGGGGGAATGDVALASASPSDVVLLPVPAASVVRQDDICKSLIEQLSAVQLAEATPPQALLDSAVSYIAGRRHHAMAVPPQLLNLTALGLAAMQQWKRLDAVLLHVPPGGLSGCSDVLVAAAAQQQYGMLARLCLCLDEVEAGALVAALQHLLAPTTRANLQARQQHYATLRASAEARVAEAEQAAAAAAAQQPAGQHPQSQPHQHQHQQTAPGRSPHPHGASRASGGRGGGGGGGGAVAEPTHAVAVAQCAAAAVDGFSFREVLLHPLLAVPVDAPAVQVALRQLSGAAADALLAYLTKWVVKYTDGTLGELASGVVLPQELLFPYYHQVLEWTRMTIDAHLTRLLMARTPLPALAALEAALGAAVQGSERLIKLRGALEHISAAAALPAAHMAAATQYTAEVLDLRVR